ncbi:MAG: GNAT family N-acetyltransferase [Bacteroidota bacterium]
MQIHFIKCSGIYLEQLVQISRRTFIDAFEKDNNPDDFSSYVKQAFTKDKIGADLDNANVTFYFVYADDRLAGYFKLNENDSQTEIKKKETIELERIYVLKEFQGKKLGTAMLQEAKRIGLKRGKTFLWLGVWEENVGAIRFYQKHGFKKFGTHPYYVGKDKQTDWLMRLDLCNLEEIKI